MTIKQTEKIKTLGQLKKSGYTTTNVKEEMRNNLIQALKSNTNVFEEIKGFEESVIPQLQTAILSCHNIILLGLRGQAKTRVARLMTRLLDEFIPVVSGSEINDDPLRPISHFGRQLVDEMGDETPISWIHQDARFTEKLATPDVSVADLIGDIDPIKAAAQKLTYADERIIHFGLIPRSNRGIFVINELPDLQARIQVSQFNILQEGDIQVRGFKLRLPLDIQFIFTANPEDYTNRGSIVTPLKDRIDSQILTHYPRTIDVSREITAQEAQLGQEQKERIQTHPLVADLIEQVAFEARQHELVDQKSGVSARLTISAFENLHSMAERRLLLNGETKTLTRISDLYGIIPSITGKLELVYEGELEGISSVAFMLIGKSIRTLFVTMYPDPEKIKKSKLENPYTEITQWFAEGNTLDFLLNENAKDYMNKLSLIPGLAEVVKQFHPKVKGEEKLLHMEFVLHGLSEFSQLSKHKLDTTIQFKDLVGSIFNFTETDEDSELN